MMSGIRIEPGIPIPPRGRKPGKYEALRYMQIGDSFLVEGKTTRAQIGTTLINAEANGRKFTTRQEGKNLRVWRIK